MSRALRDPLGQAADRLIGESAVREARLTLLAAALIGLFAALALPT